MIKEINKIAIVRLSALGDIVNAAIILQFIRFHYPHVSIEWVCEEVFAPLLLTNKDINKVHTINLKKIKKTKSFSLLKENIKKLRNLREFDLIIDMQGLLKSAIVSRIIGKNTHGFDSNSSRESLSAIFYKSSSKISYETSVILRNTFLISDALGFEINESMILNKKPIFQIKEEFVLQKEKKNIAFVIGASWDSKIYPKEHIADICNALKEQCYIIYASEQEREDAEWITCNSTYAILAPKLDLAQLVSFISSMDLLIGNDTGPTHLAWAQNIPSITLFGPTTTRMMYETPLHVGIKSPSSVNLLKIDKTDYSIKNIQFKLITHKAKELLYGL